MNILSVTTPFNIELELVVAPFGKRLAAWALDMVVVLLYVFAWWNLGAQNFLDDGSEAGIVFVIFTLYLPILLYDFLQELFFNGQSLGKRAVGLRVTDLRGNEPTLSQYLLRSAFRMLDFLGTLGVGALISSLVTRYGQRLGDLVAGTLVIEGRLKANIGQTIYRPVDAATYTPKYPSVMRLTDRDINGIRNLIHAKPTKDQLVYNAQVAHRIREVLGITEETGEPIVFLQRLLEDYNFLSSR